MKVQGLKPKHRAKALDNMLDYYGDVLTVRAALEMELISAFPIGESREGKKYWLKIINKYDK